MKIVPTTRPVQMDASSAALDALKLEVERLKEQLSLVRQESDERLMSLRAEWDATARARAAEPVALEVAPMIEIQPQSKPEPAPIVAPAPAVVDPLFAQMWSYVNAPRG